MKIKAKNSARARRKGVTVIASSPAVVDQHALEKDVLEQRLLTSSDAGAVERERALAPFTAGVAVMLLLLAAQALYLYREQAVEIGLIASTFKSLGYTPPQMHHPEMIGLTNRVFTDVEGQRGLYRLQLGLMNHAPRPQSFPLIEVSLTDTQGVIRARNRFHAKEYLPASVVGTQMSPNEEHTINFVMQSSAADIMGFMLDFF